MCHNCPKCAARATKACFVNALHKPAQGTFYCCEAGWLATFGDKFFHPSLKHPSSQKHSSLAFKAFKADVGAHPHYFPLVAAAGVRFAQPDYIAHPWSDYCPTLSRIVIQLLVGFLSNPWSDRYPTFNRFVAS